MSNVEPASQSEIINELRQIKKEVIAVKRQIAGSVAFGVIGAGVILAFMSGIFSAIIGR